MTSYWLLIEAGKEISLSSKFYKVAVANSVKGMQDFSILQQEAQKKNWFLQKWSAEALLFIDKIAQSLKVHVIQMPLQVKKCHCLVQSLKCAGRLPEIQSMSSEARQLIETLIPELRIKRILKVIHRAEAEKRKKPKFVMSAKKATNNK